MPVGGYYSDAAYQKDFVTIVTVPTAGPGTFSFKLPQPGDGATPLTWRYIRLTDVTAATGGTQNTLISVYYRIDGQTASAGAVSTADEQNGSYSRILLPGASVVVNRVLTGPITFFCPASTHDQKILVELGG